MMFWNKKPAPKPVAQPWYMRYNSGRSLVSKDAKITLSMFTEDTWDQQICMNVKLSSMKLTLEQSYMLWSHWVNTGVWLKNYSTKEPIYFVDGTVRYRNREEWK